jgi:flagellar hook-basal body protein
MAIVGNGFLVSKSGNTTLLTRAGNLTFDGAGNLVDQNGGLIQGLNATIQYNVKALDAANALNITSAKLGFTSTSAASATDINITRDMTEPPNATQVVNFSGNLDSFLQATDAAHGGVFDITGLPMGQAGIGLNGAVFNILAGPPQTLQQIDNADQGVVGNPDVASKGNLPNVNNNNWTEALVTAPAGDIGTIQAAGNIYVWDQQPPQNPAQQIVETVYDSTGNPRSLTINLYQVNDLGNGLINSPTGPSQTAYAWYAFDTTNGAPVNTASLVGGTGIHEGETPGGVSYDRGVAGDEFWGDLLVFNTDGSLLSTGGAENNGDQSMPNVYLPPLNTNPPSPNAPASPLPSTGAQITQITLNFGTAGSLGLGRRDGVYGDAEGSYQVVNGVNTYVPKSTAFAKSQDGFTDGILTGVQFDATGTIIGSFSNGQNTAIGQVVLAMPNNEGGLTKVGSNYFAQSANSGALFVGFAGQDGVGTVQGNTLELSNVDLTVELSNMIIAQRGFEVNARVISVTNSTLQTTVQLGQGG